MLECRIEPVFIKLHFAQPEQEDQTRVLDAADIYGKMSAIADAAENDDQYLDSFAEFLKQEFDLEYCPRSMAIQTQAAITRGWEEFKKKAAGEQLLPLNMVSTPTASIHTSPPPSAPTSADSAPSEPMSSAN